MKRRFQAVGFAVLVAGLHTLLFLFPWGEALEHRFLDLWFSLRGSATPPPGIVIVTMDEESYGVLGFSPNQAWPRSAHAALLRRLATNGAQRVVMDILFEGESASPAADDELAEAMRRIPTIIGAEVREVVDAYPLGGVYTNKMLSLPLAKFGEAATVALIGLPQERGYIRHFLVPDALRTREVSRGLPSLADASSGANRRAGARDLVRFYGPARTIPTYSYYQALETEVPLPARIFQNKIVFVGLGLQSELGPALKDQFLTSFGLMFGVEIHATAAANLLENKWLRRGSATMEAGALAILSMVLTFALLRLRPTWGAVAVLAYDAGWAALAYGSFQRGISLPGATLAAVILPAAYLGATLWNYLTVRRQELRLERAFRFYLSPEMAREVARNPEALQLGGEEVECTAMFTDIAGFTSIAEKMKPAEVSAMLNSYFTEVMDAVFEKRGTVIQFIGDGVYALWGAPARTGEHARLCCEAALAIGNEIERFNQSGRFPPLRTRFGINTGPVLVGNLGAKRRFDFTGIGDTVNLASRLEGLNKYFGTTILLTDSTRAQLPANVASLKMGLIRAVGKTLPVGLHTLFREPVAAAGVADWTEACRRFVARDWPGASALFAAVARTESRLAKSVDLYQRQIALHESTPPAAEWEGEIIFTAK